MTSWCQWQGEDLLLAIRIKLRAAKNEWIGLQAKKLDPSPGAR